MEPTSFDEANTILSPPSGMSLDECSAISAYKGADCDGRKVVISCYKLESSEVEHLAKGGRLWLHVLGDSMPPVAITTKHPFRAS